MSAFFFGPAERQLFGFYHAPRGAGTGAAVLCPSWGPEYQYAHRALRVTARRLAENGFHVLRFDYSGVGDSWGDTTDGDLDRWPDDVALAVHELKAMSNQPRIDLVGLRIGATTAARAAAALSDIRRIVLWDPVLDGAAWTRRFKQSRPVQRSGADERRTMEFAQRLVAAELVERFAAIDATHYTGMRADGVLLLETQSADENPADTASSAASQLQNVPRLQHMFVEDAAPWLEDNSIWSGLVPAKAIRAVVDWLGQP